MEFVPQGADAAAPLARFQKGARRQWSGTIRRVGWTFAVICLSGLTMATAAHAQIAAGRYTGSVGCGLGAPYVAEILVDGAAGTATVRRSVDEIEQSFKFRIVRSSDENWNFDLVPTEVTKRSARGKSAGFSVRYYEDERRLYGKSIGVNNVDCTDLSVNRQASSVAPPVIRVGALENLIPERITAMASADTDGPVNDTFYTCLANAHAPKRMFYMRLRDMKKRGQPMTAQAQVTVTVEAAQASTDNACRMEEGSRFNVRRAFDALTAAGPPPGF